MYKPSTPFSVAMKLLAPTTTSKSGVAVKAYQTLENGTAFNGSFKSYGGTERDVNGLYSIEDTATVETWYRPEIKSDCRVAVLPTGEIYEILGKPENIDLRNQYLRFKVRRVAGGA